LESDDPTTHQGLRQKTETKEHKEDRTEEDTEDEIEEDWRSG